MRLTAQRLYAIAARASLHVDINARIVWAHRLRPRLVARPLTHQCFSTAAARRASTELYSNTRDEAPVEGITPRQIASSAPSNTGRSPDVKQPLPISCPGCGALSQETTSNEAGFYSRSRKAVRLFLRQQLSHTHANGQEGKDPEITAISTSENDHTAQIPDSVSVSKDEAPVERVERQGIPVCDRCHDLIYYAKGQSIAHPSVEDLADSIAESPFNRNHVYHVLDAADFPMSLIPGIFKKLELAKPRSQNRRSRHKFPNKPTMSFVITRSDLLGPTKDMVDKLMPYFQSVLRTALGKTGRDIRLGNVHLVSAKRGWWTKDIKESIWERGGGNWMVGRVNVGKSNLFEVLFPKGSGERAPVYAELHEEQANSKDDQSSRLAGDFLSENSLLPPAQPEVPFPAMPIVSNLPGTTASPIRLPFGNQRGELIDLPGIERGSLEDHVQQDHKLDLVMQHRPKVEQHIIKPGQSLLLGGGLIRLTPELNPDDRSTTMLAYPFVPVEAHVTATEKAVGTQLQERESGIQSILANGSGPKMASAGILELATDVTRARAGPLLRAGVPVNKLPFRIYSTDILVEGVGWVELVCQVRRRWKPAPSQPTDTELHQPVTSKPADGGVAIQDEPAFKPFFSQAGPPKIEAVEKEKKEFEEFPVPKVEIFSPNGKHIAQRKPLGAWLLWDDGSRRRAREAAAGRPRKSMKGVKKQAKVEKRKSENID